MDKGDFPTPIPPSAQPAPTNFTDIGRAAALAFLDSVGSDLTLTRNAIELCASTGTVVATFRREYRRNFPRETGATVEALAISFSSALSRCSAPNLRS